MCDVHGKMVEKVFCKKMEVKEYSISTGDQKQITYF